MVAAGFGAVDKVSKTGDTMTGTLVLSGSTPLQVTTGSPGVGKQLTSDSSGVATWASPPAVNVKTAYGAKGDGTTNDTTAIQNAISALNAAGGGRLYFPPGTYLVSSTLTMYANCQWWGAGKGSTTLKLANGANCDLIQSTGFAGLTGGTSASGPNLWSIQHMTLDGNGANQTGTSWPLRVYAYNYEVSHVEIINGHTGNVWSEWGTGGSDMEAKWSHFKIMNSTNGHNLVWNGPHDSQFHDGQVVRTTATNGTFHGIITQGNAGGEQFANVHVWGIGHDVGFNLGLSALAVNCVAEGATTVNVKLLQNVSVWCGSVFGTANANSPTEIGVQIGDGTHQVTNYLVEIISFQWTATGHVPIYFSNDGGGVVIASVTQGSATNITTGTVSSKTSLHLLSTDTSAGKYLLPMATFVHTTANQALTATGANDKFNVNTSAGLVEIVNGAKLRGYTGNYSGTTWTLDAALGTLQSGSGATASRPSASSAGVGGMWYDTTLHKPIWSDGSAWRDATGATV